MIPGTRAQRRHDIASIPYPSVEDGPNCVTPVSDSNNLNDNADPSSTGYILKNTLEIRTRRRLPTPEPKSYDPETYGACGRKYYGEGWYERRNARLRDGITLVSVLREKMRIPQTCDFDTYDPDKRVAWTPEPEPYDTETYAAWGRKYFGDDWFEQRKTMLEERNICMEMNIDPVYIERQRALRILEHRVEGRPFKPVSGVFDEGWK